MARVAINGLGRIGRATLRILMGTPGLDLVAANDLGAPGERCIHRHHQRPARVGRGSRLFEAVGSRGRADRERDRSGTVKGI